MSTEGLDDLDRVVRIFSSGSSGHEHNISMDHIIEESSGQRFSAEEKAQFISFEKALKVDEKTRRSVNPKIQNVNPKIQKVPALVQYNKKLKQYFQPKMFSFGPSSYRAYTCETEQIKFNLAAEFLKMNDVEKEDLYEDIKTQINELKNCYNDLTYICEDHELAWMFLVDGCAILQFMYISVEFWEIQDTEIRNSILDNDYEGFMVQDLFLVENQLPYQLLQRIIRHASKQDKLLKSIYKFIFCCFRTPKEWNENKDEILKYLKHDHVHLLDLLRKQLIQPLHKIDKKLDLIEIIIGWIVDLSNKLKYNRNEFDQDRFPVPFRNIKKLSEAGINLKRSKTSCVTDISFSSGTLKLYPFIVEESTARMILNMIAYEMCPDFHNESEVSTYMYILNKLIDQTQDVEELREKNIHLNRLDSDEDVVKLFKEISTILVPNFKKYYAMKRNIDNYFDNKWLMWLHKVFHDIHQYFKGRWSLLAFIGALLAVASSIIQTVITVLAYQSDSKKGI